MVDAEILSECRKLVNDPDLLINASVGVIALHIESQYPDSVLVITQTDKRLSELVFERRFKLWGPDGYAIAGNGRRLTPTVIAANLQTDLFEGPSSLGVNFIAEPHKFEHPETPTSIAAATFAESTFSVTLSLVQSSSKVVPRYIVEMSTISDKHALFSTEGDWISDEEVRLLREEGKELWFAPNSISPPSKRIPQICAFAGVYLDTKVTIGLHTASGHATYESDSWPQIFLICAELSGSIDLTQTTFSHGQPHTQTLFVVSPDG